MESTSYFLPLAHQNIAHIFSEGMVKPSNLYLNSEKRISDIQTGYKNCLLLSKNRWIDGCDTSVELVFTELEKNQVIKVQEFYYFRGILPISRVKKVYLRDQSIKESVSFKIENGTAFFPDRLLEVESEQNFSMRPKDLKVDDSQFERNDIKYFSYFEKLLGGIALIKGVSDKNRKYDDFLNYVKNIHFNLEKEINRIKHHFNSSNLSDKEYADFFIVKGGWESLKEALKKESIEVSDVEKVINMKLNTKLKGGIKEIEKIPNYKNGKEAYFIAILSQYGEAKPANTDTFFQQLLNGVLPYPEAASMVFGLYNKYNSFRNKYKIADVQGLFTVKFRLETKLDYYLIEGAYQKAIHSSKEENDFSYLNECLPPVKKASQSEEWEYITLLDEVILIKKKKVFLSKDYLEELYDSFSEGLEAVWKESFKSGFTAPFKMWLNKVASQLKIDFNRQKKAIESRLSDEYGKKEFKLLGEITDLEKKIKTLQQENSETTEQLDKLTELLNQQKETTEKNQAEVDKNKNPAMETGIANPSPTERIDNIENKGTVGPETTSDDSPDVKKSSGESITDNNRPETEAKDENDSQNSDDNNEGNIGDNENNQKNETKKRIDKGKSADTMTVVAENSKKENPNPIKEESLADTVADKKNDVNSTKDVDGEQPEATSGISDEVTKSSKESIAGGNGPDTKTKGENDSEHTDDNAEGKIGDKEENQKSGAKDNVEDEKGLDVDKPLKKENKQKSNKAEDKKSGNEQQGKIF